MKGKKIMYLIAGVFGFGLFLSIFAIIYYPPTAVAQPYVVGGSIEVPSETPPDADTDLFRIALIVGVTGVALAISYVLASKYLR